jgi:hypothetical protein
MCGPDIRKDCTIDQKDVHAKTNLVQFVPKKPVVLEEREEVTTVALRTSSGDCVIVPRRQLEWIADQIIESRDGVRGRRRKA